MTAVCIAKCVEDARDPRMPVRATYVNLYKWPESDAEFVKSVTANMRRGMHAHVVHGQPRVVDSISCRQMFLRSYTFSREEELVPEKTNKCFGKAKENKQERQEKKKRKERVSSSAANNNRRRKRKKEKEKEKGSSGNYHKRRCLVIRKMKEISCSALFRIFHGCLSCATSVDVVDRND